MRFGSWDPMEKTHTSSWRRMKIKFCPESRGSPMENASPIWYRATLEEILFEAWIETSTLQRGRDPPLRLSPYGKIQDFAYLAGGKIIYCKGVSTLVDATSDLWEIATNKLTTRVARPGDTANELAASEYIIF